MRTEKHIGVINNITFGCGGYQDAMLGLTVHLSFDNYGVVDFIKGGWLERSPHAQWSVDDWKNERSKMCERITEILSSAKVGDIQHLKGKPVEVTTEDGMLKSWRILKEAIL